MSPRLSLAASSGAIPSQDGQNVLVIGASIHADLSVFGAAHITVLQDQMPDAQTWATRGVEVVQALPEGPFDATLVCLPRSKTAARAQIADAMRVTQGIVLVDGQKTDGADSLLREMRQRVDVLGTASKAHGKLFWCASGAKFTDWAAASETLEGRWITVPGVFSAGSIDEGSKLLVENLPMRLSGLVADLGAGWGFVSGRALERCAKITALHMVEAQGRALDCARQNVTDPRAEFHWADATTWTAPKPLDAVIMNPPFHTGRAAEPDLGRAFIAAAARVLRPNGALWMVANRHLPYERALREQFADVAEIASTSKFKVLYGKAKPRPRS